MIEHFFYKLAILDTFTWMASPPREHSKEFLSWTADCTKEILKRFLIAIDGLRAKLSSWLEKNMCILVLWHKDKFGNSSWLCSAEHP